MKINENLGDLAHAVELDHEVQMARSDLYKLAKYAIKLHNILKTADERQGLEGWVQAKITKASADISDVFHSIEYEMKFGNNTTDDLGKMKQGSDAPADVPFESKSHPYKNKLAEELANKIEQGVEERVLPGQKPQDYNPVPNAKPNQAKPSNRRMAKADPNIELMGRGMIDYKGMQFKFAKGKPQSNRTRVVQAPMAAIGARGIGAVPVTLDMSTMSYYYTPDAQRRESVEQDVAENAQLTPGVRVSGKLIKYQGIIFSFAGRGAQAPKGDVIVVPPQAVGQRPKFKGKGVPVVLDARSKRFFLKPAAPSKPSAIAGKAFGSGPQESVEEKQSPAGGPGCWDGYKIGNPKTKIKDGERVNNCVPK